MKELPRMESRTVCEESTNNLICTTVEWRKKLKIKEFLSHTRVPNFFLLLDFHCNLYNRLLKFFTSSTH